MTTTSQQDKAFIDELFSRTLLEEAIEFIKNNFDIEELYGKDTLHEWARENGYIQEE